MGAVELTLLLLSSGAVYLVYSLNRQRRRFRDLPKPPHSFLWGHLNLMREVAGALPPDMHPQAYLTVIAQKYSLKGVWYLDLWPMAYDQVVLTEPEPMDAVQVARSFGVHRKAEESLGPLVGSNAIAAANGPVWKQLHHAMAPAFSTSHVRTQVGLMVAETLLFCDTLKDFSRSRNVFSLEAEASKLVFDIVGRIVFDFPLYAQTKGSTYLEDLKIIQKLAKESQSMNPLMKIKVVLEKRSVQMRVDKSIRAKISERLGMMKTMDTAPSQRKILSILDLMLREMLLDKRSIESEKEVIFEEKEIDLLISNVKVLLLAGHGTVVDTLCYVFMLLSKNPYTFQRLREEHNKVFGEDRSSTAQTLKDCPTKLNELEYTTAVIKETLRIFPVGFALREAPSDATLVYNNRTYPIGDTIIVPCWHTMHFDPRYYPEPDDFRPERFTGDGIPRSWFRSFSRGSRACLGQNLSLDIMRVILLLTVRDFDFTCHGLNPNAKPKATYTNLDTIYGDVVFQELGGLEARPRGGMMMTVANSEP